MFGNKPYARFVSCGTKVALHGQGHVRRIGWSKIVKHRLLFQQDSKDEMVEGDLSANGTIGQATVNVNAIRMNEGRVKLVTRFDWLHIGRIE